MKTKIKKLKGKLYKPEVKGEKDFYDSINKAMKTSEHKDGLLEIIRDFETYKKEMQDNMIVSILSSDEIYSFRFTYQLKKNVWKDIEALGDQTLEELAEFLIEKMDWNNDHLHAFFFPRKEWDGLRYWYNLCEIGSEGVDNDQYPTLHTDEVFVSSIDYKKHLKLGFVFDFGDDHRFMMELKGKRIANKQDKKADFPRTIDQRGVGPEQYPPIWE